MRFNILNKHFIKYIFINKIIKIINMKYLFLILIASCSLLGIAQNTLPADVDKSIQDRITNGHSPSIVVGIIDKNGPQYYLYGTKTIGGEAVDEHSIYEIGSISKTFTGILLAQMVLNKN